MFCPQAALLFILSVKSLKTCVGAFSRGVALVLPILLGLLSSAARADFGFETPTNDFPEYSGKIGFCMATDGAGKWVKVYSWSDAMYGDGFELDLFVSRSLDDGITWSSPALLNEGMTSDTEYDAYPSLAYGNGAWVVVWEGRFGIYSACSTNDGASWTSRVQVNSQTSPEFLAGAYPKIATDGAGTWVACWFFLQREDTPGFWRYAGDLHAAVSTSNGSTWGTRSIVQLDTVEFAHLNDLGSAVVFAGADTFIVAWTSNNALGGMYGSDFDVLYSRRAIGGTSWSAPQALSHTALGDADDTHPALAADGSGNVLVVWPSDGNHGLSEDTDADLFARASSDFGQTWTSSVVVTSGDVATANDMHPSLATDRFGRWLALWAIELPTWSHVAAALSTDAGDTWSSQGQVGSFAEIVSGTRLAAGRTGTWEAMYEYELSSMVEVCSMASRYDLNAGSSDNDLDGISNEVEGNGDPDRDGQFNYVDTDSDGDWVLDVNEGVDDGDSDELPNFLDTDSDNDGFGDGVEVEMGSDPFDANEIPELPLRALPVAILLMAAIGYMAVTRYRMGKACHGS